MVGGCDGPEGVIVGDVELAPATTYCPEQVLYE
jgi:hypothetical protein